LLVFYTFSILSILDPLERQSLCGLQKTKDDFFGVKDDFFGVKDDFFGVKDDFFFYVVY
jgi:hypothetical protein